MDILRRALPVFLALGLFAAMPALASAATLWVYVDVNDSRYDADDFTVEVDGEDASPDSFRGDEDGRKVRLDEGDYDVEIRNDRGLRVSYSSGCEGDIDDNDTERCRITINDNNYYQPYQPYQPYPIYTPPVTIQKGYIPALPSTGFPPLSSLSVILAVLLLGGAGYLLYPYARAAFTAVLR
jgi:hypothetical protein